MEKPIALELKVKGKRTPLKVDLAKGEEVSFNLKYVDKDNLVFTAINRNSSREFINLPDAVKKSMHWVYRNTVFDVNSIAARSGVVSGVALKYVKRFDHFFSAKLQEIKNVLTTKDVGGS